MEIWVKDKWEIKKIKILGINWFCEDIWIVLFLSLNKLNDLICLNKRVKIIKKYKNKSKIQSNIKKKKQELHFWKNSKNT